MCAGPELASVKNSNVLESIGGQSIHLRLLLLEIYLYLNLIVNLVSSSLVVLVRTECTFGYLSKVAVKLCSFGKSIHILATVCVDFPQV